MAASRHIQLFLLLATFLAGEAENLRPIVGVVSERYGSHNTSYIAASYVKFLEAAGARVVPILNSYSEEQVKFLFQFINGVLFPGGGANLNDSAFYDVGHYIYQLAIEANDNGDYFPLWGTCLGFELLAVLTSGTDTILGYVDAENLSLPLDFVPGYGHSRLFSAYSLDEQLWLHREPLTMNNHQRGVLTETFHATPSLNTFYNLLSTNKGQQGKEFVSTVEAYKYPIYGSQWHPEKNIFEWTTKEGINHSEHAVIITQTAANFFVSEARKSAHKFPSEEEADKWLIYNYNMVYTGKEGIEIEQAYFFQE